MVGHGDASLANCPAGQRTQGGLTISVAEKKLLAGSVAKWSFLAWKSVKLGMARNPTLLTESQALLEVLGKLEWMLHRLGDSAGYEQDLVALV